jgi:hypothetical protein
MASLTLASVVLVATACTGGGAGDDRADDHGGSVERASADTDPRELRDQMTELLASYDDVVNQILADPGVTRHEDDPLVDEYLRLFEPDSEFATEALDKWRANADDGITIEPYDDAHPSNRTRLDGDVEVVSDHEVRFPTCSEFRQLVYQGGKIVEGLPFMEQAGQAVAVRDGDDWVFRRRDVFADQTKCQTHSESDSDGRADGPAETEGT